ncbi:hypothetical protein Tco_0077164 [Tanacetum coccineum]
MSTNEGLLMENVDNGVLDGPKEQLLAVAKLAKICSHLNGNIRPAMKEVATELEPEDCFWNSLESTDSILCYFIFHYISWYQEPKFLIKMFPRRSEGKESEYPFFKCDGSSSDEWRDYGMAGDDYEGPPVFDDDQYEEESMPVYDTDIEDVIEEEEGFVRKRGFGGEEEGFIRKGGFDGEEENIEDVVVVANDLCSSMIQTILSVDFEEDINTKSHELMSFEKKYYYQGDTNLDATSTKDE